MKWNHNYFIYFIGIQLFVLLFKMLKNDKKVNFQRVN